MNKEIFEKMKYKLLKEYDNISLLFYEEINYFLDFDEEDYKDYSLSDNLDIFNVLYHNMLKNIDDVYKKITALYTQYESQKSLARNKDV
jgi:hypothetical protein